MAYSKPIILTALLATLGVALFFATQQNAQHQAGYDVRLSHTVDNYWAKPS